MGYYLDLLWQVLPAAAAAGLACLLVRLARRRLGREGWGRELVGLAFVCYLAGLLALVWAPRNLWRELGDFLRHGRSMSWPKLLFTGSCHLEPPFLHYFNGEMIAGSWIREMLLGNVLMFVPLGFLLPLRFPGLTGPGALLAGAAIDLVIELFQPVVGRSFDTEDLACNIAGIAAGLVLGLLARGLAYGPARRGRIP